MSGQARDATPRRLTICLFGPFAAWLDGTLLGGFEYNKVRALLAYLAVETEHPHTRASLCALLWPALGESAARQNLSQALARLRQVLGDKQAAPPLLLATTETVQLNPLARYEVDVIRFTTLVADAEAHAHRAWHLCTPCAAKLRAAVADYTGDFLAQFDVTDSAPFGEWALLRRQRLRRLMLSALERLVWHAEWHGDYVQAAHFAQRQVELEPLREHGHRELMRLLALSAQHAAALTEYAYLQQTLATERNAEPEPETTALYEQIRAGSGITGLRRLRAPSSDLPSPPTPLLGRETEVQRVCEQLLGTGTRPAVRLLTLTGAPGIGKTRLALEVAQQVRFDFEDGVQLVELAPVLDAAQVPGALARVLGIKEQAHRTLAEAVCDHLRSAHSLLVLDNFEQVLDAAPFVADLLRACPALAVLITSRAPLHLRAEYQYVLEPLAIPAEDAGLDATAQAAAVQLFVTRARAVRPEFALTPDNAAAVATICRRLDGLPLAIELITPRLKSLSVAEVLRQFESRLSAAATRLRDVPARHCTLRNAIQWSYDRLSAEQQHVLAHLGVFTGGFTAEAAQAIIGDTTPVLPVLEALHDASLLRTQRSANTTRFLLLQTIGEFALEVLTAGGGLDRAQQQYVEYFAQLADAAYNELLGQDQAQWSARIAAEQENLRAALACALRHDWIAAALRIATGIWRFWWQRGFLREGSEWLERALARRHAAPLEVQTKALRATGVLAMGLNDYARARQRLEQALDVARRLGATYDCAAAMTNLGLVLREQGDLDAACAYLEQSIALNRATEDPRSVKFPTGILAGLYVRLGNIAQAGALYEECLRLNRELGDAEGTANALYGVAEVAHARAEYGSARQWCEEALALYETLNHQLGLGRGACLLGHIARDQADYAQALTHYKRCLAIWMQREDRVSDASVLDDIATVVCRLGDSARAVRLMGAAQAIREGADAKQAAAAQTHHAQVLATCRAALGEKAYQGAWAEGRALRPTQAVAYALDSVCPTGVAQTRPELRVFALGPVRVYCGDRLLTSADWTYAKARELVLYLLCHPDATREEIAVEFWPDATTEQVRQRFSAALTHARSALGRDVDWVILSGRRYRFNREQPYWFDVDVFEAGLREARRLLRTGTQDERATGMLEKAVNLYQNEFAPDVLDGEWHVARREALRYDYLEALLALGRLHAKAGRDEQAITWWKTAIAKDPYLEDARLEVIRAYARLGQRRQALGQYETLKKVLAELNVLPSAETTALIERLLRGEPL